MPAPAPVQSKPVTGPSKVRARLLQCYAGKKPGEVVEVDAREYDRLRTSVIDEDGVPTGRYHYDVLITDEHRAAQERADADARAAADLSDRARRQTEDPDAWARMQQDAREVLDRMALERQKRINAKMIGDQDTA